MSFGGAVSSMVTSIKNNKRNRKSTFEKLESYQKDDNDSLHFTKNVTESELEEIKFRVRKEKRSSLIKNIVFLIIAFLFLYFLVGFVIF
ncbi:MULTISPECIES: hypothetical protein [Tenacibaculum]|uniref:hypothetical protein n=1 Tax=Tenacibaculum TaxID=104267 RepID=UPI000421F71F|nr:MULTISPECIES: hypothetical protein [Tenacibaculum]WBX71603.1 hypothetical protein PG912_02085 [Tenacibaculum retecalamus]